MLPSPSEGKAKTPGKLLGVLKVGLLVKRKELSKPALLSDLVIIPN
jgi:hypothetical protein